MVDVDGEKRGERGVAAAQRAAPVAWGGAQERASAFLATSARPARLTAVSSRPQDSRVTRGRQQFWCHLWGGQGFRV